MTTDQKLIRNKLGLLDLANYLKNVSEACRVMGYSRDTFYRVKNAYEDGGLEALKEKSKRIPNLRNRIPEDVETAILDITLEDPSMGQKRVSDELRRRGVFVSAAGVRCVWLRHGLERFQKRLKALEVHVAKTGHVLTEAQLKAMEKAQEEKVALGEIETEHVGYLGAQDTYYVGNIKGVGRIYQQTFIDTFSSMAMAKLYTSKHPINSADFLNDRVVPFFDEKGIPLLKILTDRGTEYCGNPTTHEFQLFLALNDIHKRMVSVSDSTRQSKTSSTASPSEGRSTSHLMNSRKTSMFGSINTTTRGLIRENGAREERPWIPSTTTFLWRKKNRSVIWMRNMLMAI
jgi:hypothetical protein